MPDFLTENQAKITPIITFLPFINIVSFREVYSQRIFLNAVVALCRASERLLNSI